MNPFQAYVLVQGGSGGEGLAGILRKVTGVDMAENLAGPYDAIALIGSAGFSTRFEDVVAEISQLPGVDRVLTTPIVSVSEEDRAA